MGRKGLHLPFCDQYDGDELSKSVLLGAFVAGFMASGEGFNGEYCGKLDPEWQAKKLARKWVKETNE